MAHFFVIFNHTLTEEQRAEAYDKLQVTDIVLPPARLIDLWAHIPPETRELTPLLAPLFKWLDENAVAGDYVLVQGEFGATFLVVRHCAAAGLKPVYSTTKRSATEEVVAENAVKMTRYFHHVQFRAYEV